MHYATSCKVAGSFSDEVIKCSIDLILQACTMVLGSTQPLTEVSNGNAPGGKGRPARKADNLIAICELIVHKMWEPRRLKPYGPRWPVRGIALQATTSIFNEYKFMFRICSEIGKLKTKMEDHS
jgi:hypothetical protein